MKTPFALPVTIKHQGYEAYDLNSADNKLIICCIQGKKTAQYIAAVLNQHKTKPSTKTARINSIKRILAENISAVNLELVNINKENNFDSSEWIELGPSLTVYKGYRLRNTQRTDWATRIEAALSEDKK